LLDEKILEQLEKFVLDKRASPLSASDSDLVALPRTHIMLSEFDPLRDDGVNGLCT